MTLIATVWTKELDQVIDSLFAEYMGDYEEDEEDDA